MFDYRFLTGSLLTTLCVLLPHAVGRCDDVPLHQRIDQAIEAQTPDYPKIAAPVASDEEFLRRIYLDLTGSIPTAAETRAFLDDKTDAKRAAVVDRLLASPEHARHMQHVFDVLLLDRRPDKYVPRAEWQEYLRKSFADNKPYDQLVREILGADGVDPAKRAPAKFFLEREAEPHIITRDITRLFLGMNMQCCQCHDHPHWKDFKQEMYYGIFAFMNRTVLFTEKDKRVVLGEKAEGDVTYQNVFDAKMSGSAAPHVPFGKTLEEPKFEKGQEYEVAPAKDVRPVPKYSRRAQLAGQIASADNVPFKRHAANRLWALMMGRGLIYPVDQDFKRNPPSHPELLALLTDEFAKHNFDVRWYLRELVLTKTYQRSSELPKGAKEVDAATFAVAQLKPLSPEQLAFSLMQATGFTDVERKAQGDKLTEATLYARLAGNIPPFVATFGGQPGQLESFTATLDQALFLQNGDLIRGWIAARPGNLTDRLIAQPNDDAVADELYLSVFARRPTADEKQEVAGFLKKRAANRPAALGDLVWALITSAEFRFIH